MRAAFHGIGLPVSIQPPPIRWLLRDDFSDTRAAGAVNGTPATPGPGTRVVVADVSGGISTGSEALNIVGNGNWGQTLYALSESIARSPGVLMTATVTFTGSTVGRLWIGPYSSKSSLSADHLAIATIASNNLCLRRNSEGTSVPVFPISLGTAYPIFILLRATGKQFFVKSNNTILLQYIDDFSATATLYFCAEAREGDAKSVKKQRVAFSGFLAVPLASDGFGSSFGVTDGLGHQEGVAGGIGSGGGGLAWTQQVGTWSTSGGKAVATALTGGVAIATVPLSSANVFAGVAITRTANSVGPVVRYVDADNYVYAVHDGTNSKLVKRVAGTETVLVNVAATYSANASQIVDCNGTAFRLYYNNTLSGTSTISDSVLQSGTLAGILTKDTGNTLDNFIVYAKGAEGQYSNLSQYTV